jgi:hypothetical protein
MNFNILSIVDERGKYRLGLLKDWHDEIYIKHRLAEADEMLVLMLPRMVIDFSIHRGGIFKDIFNNWSLNYVFEVHDRMMPSFNFEFQLLIFSHNPTKKVLMGSYEGENIGSLHPNAKGRAVTGTDWMDYSKSYMSYLKTVEETVVNKKLPKNSPDTFFSVGISDIKTDHISVSFYDPYFKKYEEVFEGEEVVPLSELVEIVRPKSIKSETELPMLRISDFKYPLDVSSLPKKERVFTQLQKGDVLIPSIVTSPKCYYVHEETPEPVYSSNLYFILRNLDKRVSPEYLFYYFQSDVIRKYLSRYAVGTAMQRYRTQDFLKFPVIVPSATTLKRTKELFKVQFSPSKENQINEINAALFAKNLPKEKIQNEFILEELDELKKWKLGILDEIVQADLAELNICLKEGAYKSSLILSGSILEAVLIDWISEIEQKNYLTNSKQLKLDEMIRRAVQAGVIQDVDAEIAHKIRGMRNLVHPKVFFKKNSVIDEKLSRDTIKSLKGLLDKRFKNK